MSEFGKFWGKIFFETKGSDWTGTHANTGKNEVFQTDLNNLSLEYPRFPAIF